MSQNAGFLSQNAGLRDASRPYVRGSRSISSSAPILESPMSRRHLTLVLVAFASLVITACGVSPTAPRHDDDTAIVVVGSGG
jgi:hypothetical protein